MITSISFSIAVLAGLTVAGIFFTFLPNLFFDRYEVLTPEQFYALYPKYKWMDTFFLVEFILVMALLLGSLSLICFLLFVVTLGGFALTFGVMAICDGVITATSGVCHKTYRGRPSHYIVHERLRRVGWSQIIGGVFISSPVFDSASEARSPRRCVYCGFLPFWLRRSS